MSQLVPRVEVQDICPSASTFSLPIICHSASTTLVLFFLGFRGILPYAFAYDLFPKICLNKPILRFTTHFEFPDLLLFRTVLRANFGRLSTRKRNRPHASPPQTTKTRSVAIKSGTVTSRIISSPLKSEQPVLPLTMVTYLYPISRRLPSIHRQLLHRCHGDGPLIYPVLPVLFPTFFILLFPYFPYFRFPLLPRFPSSHLFYPACRLPPISDAFFLLLIAHLVVILILANDSVSYILLIILLCCP